MLFVHHLITVKTKVTVMLRDFLLVLYYLLSESIVLHLLCKAGVQIIWETIGHRLPLLLSLSLILLGLYRVKRAIQISVFVARSVMV